MVLPSFVENKMKKTKAITKQQAKDMFNEDIPFFIDKVKIDKETIEHYKKMFGKDAFGLCVYLHSLNGENFFFKY
jgi:Zn/Cd-binding protein ZinT